jgi:mannose-6-phosphate isomerase
MYPLKFKPILFSKIWGGNKIKNIHPEGAALENIGESWEISAVDGACSVAADGFLQGNSLDELVEVYLGDLVGEKIYDTFGELFPLLVKIINSAQNLSIQVHPNNETALERHNSLGKNEMWYVLDAEPEAFIIAGFNKKITTAEYLEAVANGTIESLLKKIPVEKEDTIYIPAGCVHAVGKGCLLLEIQQTSDITYRIYDYNRLDDNGLRRELHTELAVDAIDFENWENNKIMPKIIPNEPINIIDSEYFTTNILKITQNIELDLAKIDSFVLISVVEGEIFCEYDEGKIELKTPETVLIPASMYNIVLVPKSKEAKVLQTFIRV